MAPIGDKKYRITGTVGETLKPTINFKFFYQKGWGGALTYLLLICQRDLLRLN